MCFGEIWDGVVGFLSCTDHAYWLDKKFVKKIVLLQLLYTPTGRWQDGQNVTYLEALFISYFFSFFW